MMNHEENDLFRVTFLQPHIAHCIQETSYVFIIITRLAIPTIHQNHSLILVKTYSHPYCVCVFITERLITPPARNRATLQ